METSVLREIALGDLAVDPLSLFDKRWFLLTAGDFSTGQYNTMTISWGSLGTVWNKPFAQVFCRPQRHTFSFLETFPTFTLSMFRPACRSALQFLGSKSGRESNKIVESGLTPVAALRVDAPTFAEAELVFECRKVHAQRIDPRGFKDVAIDSNYPTTDYHFMFFGEVVVVRGTAAYIRQ